MTTPPTAGRRRARSTWSLVVCTLAIPAGAVAIAAFAAHRFAAGWSAVPAPRDEVPWYWVLVGTAAVLSAVAIAALASRRWFLAVVAMSVAGSSGVLALGLHQEVAHLVDAPSVEAPMPCQCRSGGDCGCPGG